MSRAAATETRRDRGVMYDHERYQARKEAGLCTACSKRPAEAGKSRCSTCAGKRAEDRRRQIEEGRCMCCGELRGEDGTLTHCRACTGKLNAKDRERYRSRVGERLCVDCGRPLGEGGTDRSCRPCLDNQNRQHHEGRRRRFESGLCPQHGTAMPMLELCPACRYEQPGGRITDLTFEELLPPSSGDELEACVGCKNCERLYHAGSRYRVPPIPRDLKLKDEYVGVEDHGIWLRFAEENEQGVEAEYEGCSTPEKKCARVVSKNVALKYLTAHRRGEKVPGRCYEHFRDPAAYEEVIAARLRQQLAVTAQPPNGNGQGNGETEKRNAERAEFENVVSELLSTLPLHKIRRAQIAAALDSHRNTREPLDPSTVTYIVKRCYPKGMTVADAVALVADNRER